MKTMNWSSIVWTDREGNRRTPEEGCEVSFRYETFDGGYVCYVTAHADAGFDGDESLILRPDISDTSDYLSIVNHSPYWCRPAWGTSLSELHKRTQELLIRDGDTFRCYLPLCADTFKTLLRGGEEGMEFFLYSNCSGMTDCSDQPAFICMEGADPLALLHKIAKKAADVLGNGLQMRSEKQMAEVFEYLGWCSWDALQIRVSHKGLMEKVEEFVTKGVPVQFAIIDDMWADIPGLNDLPEDVDRHTMIKCMHASKMRNFAGDPERFPEGIEAAIRDMKAAGMPRVGIWFPTTGYWSGFVPEGAEAERQAENTILTEAGQYIVAPEVEKATRLFSDLCSRVKAWGGSFVKIDNQGFHNRYQDVTPIGKSARAIQSAIDTATETHFDGALINCMGMPSECMFNRRSTVSRCSDDFLPESREWFAKNILQCAYNGLLQGQYYVNDWDMWWTDDEQARKNSLCRAVSGGPIYISDKIGRTNPEILKPITLKNGRLLRCDESATPTADCLMVNPTASGKVFKIRNRVGSAGVAAVFNIDAENRAVSGSLKPTETGVAAGDYAYYEYFTGTCGILREGESIELTLKHNDEFRLYTFVPYTGSAVCIGRTDLYVGVKAAEMGENGSVMLAEGGSVGFVSETPVQVLANGESLPTERCGCLTTVTVAPEITVLEIR